MANKMRKRKIIFFSTLFTCLLCGLYVRRAYLDASLLRYVDQNDLMHVREVLDHGADPNARRFHSFWSRVKSRALLSEKGEPILFTALHNAYNTRDYRILKILLDKGADPNMVSEYGNPASLYFVDIPAKPDWNIIQLLVSKGASISPLLHAAITDRNYARVQSLLDNGANTEYVCSYGTEKYYTPLFLAVETLQPDMVKLLLSRGADAHKSCLQCVLSRGYSRVTIRQVLEMARTDLDQENYRKVLHALQASGVK